ncbi:MAG: MobA/MobL family protein [Sphingomonadales bacterium]|nr:MobA/MobL family protein [Sphingomonadales bacterium]MDE2172025.1 MobA/MobL family protein [Sphingomonadales bacterium]
MQLQTEVEIWAQADATIFRIFMAGDRTARRMLAAERTVEGARRRCAALGKLRASSEANAHARAAREVDIAMSRAWGKEINVRMPRGREPAASRSDKAGKSKAPIPVGRRAQPQARAIRKYKAPLVDGRGRVAIYFRVRYMGLKSKKWRPGISADHAIYILREAALEHDGAGHDVAALTNMGNSVEEIAACWRALEAVEEGYRANAKVQYRIVWNLPHELTAAARHDLVAGFCERNFGRLGLPWVAAIHEPDERGDERNYHAHVCFSARPCERTGDHQWAIAQEKVNGLADEVGLKRLRGEAAAHMNTACRKAGLTGRFTHQSYQERGLNAERQAHIGPERMAAHERGEAVALIERNAQIVERNETAMGAARAADGARLVERFVGLTERSLNVIDWQRRIAELSGQVDRIRDRARAVSKAIEKPTRTPPVSIAAALAAKAQKIVAARAGHADRAAIAARREKTASIASAARTMILQRQHHDHAKRRRTPIANILDSLRHREVIAGSAHLLSLRNGLRASSMAVEKVRNAAGAMRDINDRAASRRAEHVSTAAALANARAAIAKHQEQRVAKDRQEARRLLLEVEHPPYVFHEKKVTLDLSLMTEEQAMLVRAMDRDACIDALTARLKRDREREMARHRERETQRVEADELRAVRNRDALALSASLALAQTAKADERGVEKEGRIAKKIAPYQSDWAAARFARERAMQGWDAIRQRDGHEMPLPGRPMGRADSMPVDSGREQVPRARFDSKLVGRDAGG